VKRKDLAEWEREYGGTTAEGIAKRVINKYSPSIEELSRTVNRGRGAGKKMDGTTELVENMSIDVPNKIDGEDRPEVLLLQGSSSHLTRMPCSLLVNGVSDSCLDMPLSAGGAATCQVVSFPTPTLASDEPSNQQTDSQPLKSDTPLKPKKAGPGESLVHMRIATDINITK
jgi:hypothetical protein